MPREKTTSRPLPRLPVLDAIDGLRAALQEGRAILTAEPGSGKTTLVPLMLLEEPWLQGRRILMLEPRRPAARMAARRMAALLGEPVGATVGYQVRFERQVGESTRIEVLTEGLLLRRLQADPELAGVGLLIFDEFHERNLTGDLSLALSLDVAAGLREDLRLLAMSASLDAGPLAALMSARVITAAGRQHPVEVRHADADADQRDPVPACLKALAEALDTGEGDVLVFLPGEREIRRMLAGVEARWGDRVEAVTLYGGMTAADQDRVLRGGGPRRRVILATDIAETSLTIEGVHAVVDSGLARRPSFDPNSGLTRLETHWISKASALQRCGRAGRLGSGRCFRAWTTARQARLEDFTPPEIVEADLAGLVLELANWGVCAPDDLPWLDAPPAAHWTQAVDLLRQLDALESDGRVTPLGRRMAQLPAHPRLAHILAAAAGGGDLPLAADVVAVLSERDPVHRTPGVRSSADIGLRLDALAAWRAHGRVPAGFDPAALQGLDKAARQLRRLACAAPGQAARPLDAARCLALAYPDRVAVCTSPDGRRYLMRNGRAAMLDPQDPLCGSPLLAIGSVDAGRRDGVIWLASPLDREAFEEMFAARIEARREVRWDPGQADVVARGVRRLGALLLADDPVPLRPDDPVPGLLIEQIRRQGLARFFDDPVELRARVQWMARVDGAGQWPDFSEQGLLRALDAWLLPWLRPGEGVRQLRRLNLEDVLRTELGWERLQRVEQWLPAYFETPAGTRRRIHYAAEGPPVLALPLQEVLGMSEGPALADGRVGVLLHLLSPAGRVLQVTSDLAGFWRGAYDAVKKEMRGRYPKHYWPDDPANANATRFSKRRM